MSTTEADAAVTTAGDPERCPKCGNPGDVVPDTDPPIYHHDRCGTTWDAAKKEGVLDDPPPAAEPEPIHTADPAAPPGATDDVVRPDEVRTPHDVVTPVVVERPDFDGAMERLAALPASPSKAEWQDLAAHARMLSMSPLAPKILRGNPWACMDLAMTARALGIDVFTAADLIDIIPDAGEDRNNPQYGRKTISPELINGRIQQLGLGSVRPLVREKDRCVAVALAPGGRLDKRCEHLGRHFIGSQLDYAELGYDAPPEVLLPQCQCVGVLGHTEFTWEDAQDAGLVQREGHDYNADHGACQPGEHARYLHSTGGQNGKSWTDCDCRQGYKTYPRRMMWWRAAGFCADDYFPTAGLGMYSPEELGADVDAEGRMIDVATVALPEGFEPPPDPAQAPADPAEIVALQWRISCLPDEQRTNLATEWGAKQDARELPSVRSLLAAHVAMAKGLVMRQEAIARGHQWTPTPMPPDWAPPAPGQPPAATQQAPTDAPAPQDAAPAPDAQSADGTAAQPEPGPPGADVEGRPTKPTEAAVGDAIPVVQAMTARQLNGALRERGLSDQGELDQRRVNLGWHIALDNTVAEWEATQAAADAGAMRGRGAGA